MRASDEVVRREAGVGEVREVREVAVGGMEMRGQVSVRSGVSSRRDKRNKRKRKEKKRRKKRGGMEATRRKKESRAVHRMCEKARFPLFSVRSPSGRASLP